MNDLDGEGSDDPVESGGIRGVGAVPDGGAVPQFIQALDSGHRWGGPPSGGTRYTVTYGWAQSPGSRYSYGFRPFSDYQKSQALRALALWSDVANITFVESGNPDAADLQFLSVWLYPYGAAGATTYPGDPTRNSNIYIDPFLSSFQTFAHEIGHGLGLKHPGNYDVLGSAGQPPYLPYFEDTVSSTVMAYRGYWTGSLGTYDLAAIQYLYGPNTKVRAGDDTYSLSFTYQGRYIWDGGGNDTITAAGIASTVTIDLREGGWGWISAQSSSILNSNQFFIGYGTQIENAVGGSAADTLIGSALANRLEGGGGNDTLDGGGGGDLLLGQGGDDELRGGPGDDTLDGGDGNDRVVYAFATSHAVARRDGDDLIIDGAGGVDRLRNVETLVFTDRTLSVSEAVAQLQLGDSGPRAQVTCDGHAFEVRMDAYSGPVSWLQTQYLGIASGEAVSGTAGADFMNLLGGDDAANGQDGDDVLDGGTGSNFLTGGDGNDTFYVDGRGGGVTWSTVTDLQANEWTTAWGWRPGTSRLTWAEMDGAAGYRGATAQIDLDGNGSIDMKVTFSGRATGHLLSTPGQVGNDTYIAFKLA